MTRVTTHFPPEVQVDEQTLTGFADHCFEAADAVRTDVITNLQIARARPFVFGGEASPWASALSETWNRYLENREQEAEDVRDELRYIGTVTRIATSEYDLSDRVTAEGVDSAVLDDFPLPR